MIAAAHGVHGHVKVKCFMEDPSQFKAYSPYADRDGKETFIIDKVVSQADDVLIVALSGIKDRNQAEYLKGAELMLSRDRLPKLADDTYYHADLIGLKVVSSQGDAVGIVHALYNYGAGDILEIKTPQKLEMVPFTHALVPEIDLAKGFVRLSEEGEHFFQGGDRVS